MEPPSSDRMFEQPPFLAFSIDRILSPDFGRPKKQQTNAGGRGKGSFGFIEDELQLILERLRNVEGQRWSSDSSTLSSRFNVATRSFDNPSCPKLSTSPVSPRLKRSFDYPALSPSGIAGGEENRLSRFHLRNSLSLEDFELLQEKEEGPPPSKRLRPFRSSLDSHPIKLQLKLRSSTDTKDSTGEEVKRSISPLESKPKVISSSEIEEQHIKDCNHNKPKVIVSSAGDIRDRDQCKHSVISSSDIEESVPDSKEDIKTCFDNDSFSERDHKGLFKKESRWPFDDGTVSSPESKSSTLQSTWRRSLDDISRRCSKDGKEFSAEAEDSATDSPDTVHRPTGSPSCYPDTARGSPSCPVTSPESSPVLAHRPISSPRFFSDRTSPGCSQEVTAQIAISSPSSSPDAVRGAVRSPSSDTVNPWRSEDSVECSGEPGGRRRRNSESSAITGERKEELPSGDDAWPVWVYCSRYSARPSSGPRSRRQPKRPAPSTPDEKRSRTAFTANQLTRLRAEFEESAYLSETRRVSLSSQLGLSEAQIKIWFQNRRAKVKRAAGERNPLAQKLMEHGLYNHSTHKTE